MIIINRLRGHRGFTLIEMLLAVSIASAILLVVSVSLFQGMKIFSRIQNLSEQQEIVFFFDEVTRDLRNSISYSQAPFSSSKDSLSFAALVPMAGDAHESAVFLWPVKLFNYRFDAEKKQAVRTVTTIPKEETRGKTEVMLNGISSLQFETSILSGNMPSRVTVSVGYGEEAHAHLLKKHILVPVGFRAHE